MGDVACTTLRRTTMFTYSHENTPLGQSERAYYLSYFVKAIALSSVQGFITVYYAQSHCAQSLL